MPQISQHHSSRLFIVLIVGATALMVVLIVSIWHDGRSVTVDDGHELPTISNQTSASTSQAQPARRSQSSTQATVQQPMRERTQHKNDQVLEEAPDFEPAATGGSGE